MKKTIIKIVILSLFISNCTITRKNIKSGNEINDFQNRDFYYAFTEATKQALFNNFNDAINLYNQCVKVNPQSAASYFQLSNIYLRIGKISEAKEYAKKAIRNDDKNKWYLYHLASLYQYKNEMDSALNILIKAVKIDKKNFESRFNLVLLLAENNKYNEAIEELKSITSEIGNNERTILTNYDIYIKSNNKKKAIETLTEGLTLFPNSIEIIGLMAEYYSNEGNTIKAQELYNILLSTDKGNIKIQMSYCEFLLKNERKEEAFNLLKEIIENDELLVDEKIDIIISIFSTKEIFENFKNETVELVNFLKNEYKENQKIYYLSADINSRTGNITEVAEDLKHVYETDKNNPKLIEQIINVETYLGNYDSVIAYSDQAIILFDKAIFYVFKGSAFIQMNEYNNAIKTLNQGWNKAETKQEKIDILNLLAECFRAKLNYEISDKYYEEALKIDSTNLLIRNNYSYYLSLRNHNLKRAEELSRMTIEKEPENSTYLDTYAWILYKMDNIEKAKKYIETAISFGGDSNYEIMDHYGMILLKMKKYSEAVKAFEKALLLNKDDPEIAERLTKAKNLQSKK